MPAALSRQHIACGPAWGGPAPVRDFMPTATKAGALGYFDRPS